MEHTDFKWTLPKTPCVSGFLDLPPEISHHICSYLKLKDIVPLALVNKKLNDHLNLDSFWCSLFIKDFGRNPIDIPLWWDSFSTNKLKYINNYKDFAGASDKLK